MAANTELFLLQPVFSFSSITRQNFLIQVKDSIAPLKCDTTCKFTLAKYYNGRRVQGLKLGSLSEKKTGLCGKNSQAADPTPPPQFGKPLLSKKKVGFIFHLRTSGTFLVFTKKSPFWVIDWNYVVGIGEPPLRNARILHFPQKENIVKC